MEPTRTEQSFSVPLQSSVQWQQQQPFSLLGPTFCSARKEHQPLIRFLVSRVGLLRLNVSNLPDPFSVDCHPRKEHQQSTRGVYALLLRSDGTTPTHLDFNQSIAQIRLNCNKSSNCMSVRLLRTRGITTTHLDPHLLHRSGRNDEQNVDRVRLLRIGL